MAITIALKTGGERGKDTHTRTDKQTETETETKDS